MDIRKSLSHRKRINNNNKMINFRKKLIFERLKMAESLFTKNHKYYLCNKT